jgi:hypothetical protein
MDTGLEYEGEAARKRFIVYWLRPGIAALAFGMLTFFVVSVPSEKEKMKLREEVQILRQENDRSQARLREMLPLANAARTARLTTVPLGVADGSGPWGRVLFDDKDGAGVVVVEGLVGEGRRGFVWWVDQRGERHALAAIDLTDGAGHASFRLGPDRTGSFLITLEEPEGDPSPDSAVVLEARLY